MDKMPWPKADETDKLGGWVVSPDFLIEIKRHIEASEELEFSPDMEEIEAVLLALWRMGKTPNK